MPAPIVQADYEQLNQIASRFQSTSESTQQMTENLRQLTESLHAGGWLGRGSEAFHSEMTGEVLPAMVRLFEALQQSSLATQEISQQIQDAEEAAAALFRVDPVGRIGPGGAGSLPPGAGAPGAGAPGTGAPGAGAPGAGAPGTGAPGTGTWDHGENGVDVASAAGLGGKAVNADNRPGIIPDSVPNATDLVDHKTSWVQNPETGEWQRVPYPDRPKGRLEENNVAIEAVLYENDLEWAQHEGSVWGDEWEGSYGRLEVDALGYETTGKVKLAVTAKDGLVASGTLSGEAYLGRVEYNGKFGSDAANLELKGDALAGAQATITGQGVFNPFGGDAYISAGGEAFAGATASGEIKGNIGDYGSVGADGKVGVGIGVEGRFDAGLIDGGVRLDVGIGAYLGIGASGGFTVEIKPIEIAKDIGGGIMDGAGWVGSKLGF